MSVSTEDFKYHITIDIRWRDLDALNHVNNSVYLTYLEQARTHYLHECIQWDWQTDGMILASATIDFKIALILSDKPKVYVRCSHIGNKSFTLQYCITTERNGRTVIATTATTILVGFNYQTEATQPISENKRQRLQEFENLA